MSLIDSDPCLLYFLICCSVGQLVSNLPLISLSSKSKMFSKSNYLPMCLILSHKVDSLPLFN